jgi:hypothetical protein
VVELKHLDGGGEIEVVVVGGLVLAGVDAGSEAGEEEDGEQEDQESDGAGGAWVEIGGFKWHTGFGDGDSEEDGGEEAKEDHGQKDWGVYGPDEVEAAPEEDHDADTGSSGKRDGGGTQSEEAQEDSTIASYGDQEESTPEQRLKEMQQ